MMDYKQKAERQQNREKCGVNVILRFPWKLRYKAVGDFNVSVHLFREDKKDHRNKEGKWKEIKPVVESLPTETLTNIHSCHILRGL